MKRLDARDRAISQRSTRYFTGKPCKYGHIAERLVSNWRCVECQSKYTEDFYKRNPLIRAKQKEARRESDIAKRRERYARNPEKYRAAARRFYKSNAERIREKRKLPKERAKNLSRARARQIAKLSATPIWVDKDWIAEFYECAAEMTVHTGVRHSVDHIVPIRGKSVCGLHVPWNLQVITLEENRRKSNKWVNQ